MKIVFKDGTSVFNRPDVEHEFITGEELTALLRKYDKWQYAYSAIIYHDNGDVFLSLGMSEFGNFQIEY